MRGRLIVEPADGPEFGPGNVVLHEPEFAQQFPIFFFVERFVKISTFVGKDIGLHERDSFKNISYDFH